MAQDPPMHMPVLVPLHASASESIASPSPDPTMPVPGPSSLGGGKGTGATVPEFFALHETKFTPGGRQGAGRLGEWLVAGEVLPNASAG